jgi:hypothetical protein
MPINPYHAQQLFNAKRQLTPRQLTKAAIMADELRQLLWNISDHMPTELCHDEDTANLVGACEALFNIAERATKQIRQESHNG